MSSRRHDVIAVVTRPPAVSGRGRATRESPVAAVGTELGVPVLTPHHPREAAFQDQLRELAPDCVPVVAYGALVPPAALAIPAYGWVNLHFSLLPAWRGAAPVQHAVLAGDDITGATTFQLTEGLDEGSVYGMVTEAIGPRDTAGDVLDRLADAGAQLLLATLDGIGSGALVPRPQGGDGVSFAPKITVADARIDWSVPALRIDRAVRAYTPEPGAWTSFAGQRIKVGPVSPAGPRGEAAGAALPPEPAGPPGELTIGKHDVWVSTGTVPVRLGDVQAPGKRPMPAADWARGARLGSGARFD